MDWKGFFRPTARKLVISLILFFLLPGIIPLPLFGVWLILAFMYSMAWSPPMITPLLIGLFILHIIISYLVTCALSRYLSRKRLNITAFKESRKLQITLVLLSAFLIIGVFGISAQATVKAGNCEKTYTHYYVTPFVSDYLSCMVGTPCGTPQENTIYNVNADVIECLCQDIEGNRGTIINFFNEAAAAAPGSHYYSSMPPFRDFSTVEGICNGLKHMYLM